MVLAGAYKWALWGISLYALADVCTRSNLGCSGFLVVALVMGIAIASQGGASSEERRLSCFILDLQFY